MSTNRSNNIDLYNTVTSEMKHRVAEITGKSMTYINQVLNPNNKRKSARIVALCKALVEADEAVKESIVEFDKQLQS